MQAERSTTKEGRTLPRSGVKDRAGIVCMCVCVCVNVEENAGESK